MEYPQLYKPSLAEAIDRNEKDLFRASHKLNIACKKAVETAIRENFDGMHLKTGCIAQVLEEYGTDRVNWVLANTVQQKDYDGRFSRDNKEWAKSFPVPESGRPAMTCAAILSWRATRLCWTASSILPARSRLWNRKSRKKQERRNISRLSRGSYPRRLFPETNPRQKTETGR